MSLLTKLANITKFVQEARSLPRIEVQLFGGEKQRSIYLLTQRRHPKLPIFRYKELGVGLLQIPNHIDEISAGKKMQSFRTAVNRARKIGYKFRRVDPHAMLYQIRDVNTSVPSRQGRQMDTSYGDSVQLKNWADQQTATYGIFTPDGKLAAYCSGHNVGEAWNMARVIGHADHLRDGVMYLLTREIVGVLKEEQRTNSPALKWLWYDMMLGAKPGLRQFKEQVGFRPYRVNWQWTQTPPEI